MKFEHFAVNVPDAPAHVQWFIDHLDFKLVRRAPGPPPMHFVADETGRVIIELYTNPKVPMPDHQAQPPLNFHIAMVAPDARATREKLEKAGATRVSEDVLPDGTVLIMLRDPWGVALQLCQRANPMPMPA
jgi:catechol 2,3-dioxygenase-like lactoylglutathione lyase family enzyme